MKSQNSTIPTLLRRSLSVPGVVLVGAIALVAVVLLLATVPYLNSLHGSFVFDDAFVIRDNPMVTGESASVVGLFTTVYNPGTLYRPLAMVTYLVNARLGAGVVGYHIVNVGLHALVTVAAFFLASFMILAPGSSRLTGTSNGHLAAPAMYFSSGKGA